MSPRKATQAAARDGKTRLPCPGPTTSGKSCRANPRASGYCWRHDPALLAKRKAAERNGGRRRAYVKGASPQVRTIEDVRAGLCDVIGRLQAQDNTVAVARALIAAYGELRSTLEVGELERRLAALEQLVGQSQSRRWSLGAGRRALPIPALGGAL